MSKEIKVDANMDDIVELRITKEDYDKAKEIAEQCGYWEGKAAAYENCIGTIERFVRAILYKKWWDK